jgi:hypothetical protein
MMNMLLNVTRALAMGEINPERRFQIIILMLGVVIFVGIFFVYERRHPELPPPPKPRVDDGKSVAPRPYVPPHLRSGGEGHAPAVAERPAPPPPYPIPFVEGDAAKASQTPDEIGLLMPDSSAPGERPPSAKP